MYTDHPTNSSPGPDEAPPAILRPEEDPPAWLKRPYPLVHAVAVVLLLGLAGCGGGSAEAPPVNAVGIGGTIPTHDSSGRPIAVQMTVVVTGNGVKPAGAR